MSNNITNHNCMVFNVGTLGDFLKKLQELPVYEIDTYYTDDDDNDGTEVIIEGEV